MKEILPFGQPLGGVMQIAHIVEDMDAAIEHWARNLGIGPFFVFDSFPLANILHRGKPVELDLSLALAFSGSMCFELIVDRSPGPSVYRDIREMRGYGFHHFAVSTRDFDGDVARYKAAGFETALYAEVPAVNGRAAYMDTTAALGGMVELIELNPQVEEFFAGMRRAADEWDGKDPVRRMG